MRTLNQQIRKEESIHASLSKALSNKEDQLAALQKSLEALCGPASAQPCKPLQATPGRLAIPEQPPGTCLSAGAAINRNRQQDRDLECQPASHRAGAPSIAAQAPYVATLATQQQPRPTISLLDGSGAPDAHNRGRQLRLPLSRVTQHRQTGVKSSNEPPQPVALGAIRETGASHSRPQQDSWPEPVFSNPSAGLQQRQPAKGQEALRDSPKASTAPAWTYSRAEAASQQQRISSRQPSEPNHPAIPPLLEPAPYIVEEPDSPTQEPVGRSWGVAAKQQEAMPSCLITETTITRTITPGRATMRSQCAWTVREMPQAGEQPKRQMHVTGSHGRGRGGRGKGSARKALKRILDPADEETQALYDPVAAAQRYKRAQLQAEDEVMLSDLW
ncbi:hypothetical protein CVIRNUC_008184 [Coccomyxa viridis]|uniref:Uncharacterized protein n=1 Tax=Coccomyxa viridis TaxID=1274662 RepID=A0AAV1IC97_9CHLO|nr:hypothetical protein CVIRNUC_008184 [Coccomyxa viridis]